MGVAHTFSFASLELETPDVISEIGALHEPRVCQIDQISIDGGSVHAFGGQGVDQFTVRHGRGGDQKPLEYGDSGRGAAQPRSANGCFELLERGRW